MKEKNYFIGFGAFWDGEEKVKNILEAVRTCFRQVFRTDFKFVFKQDFKKGFKQDFRPDFKKGF